jgi:hypothetical protein
MMVRKCLIFAAFLGLISCVPLTPPTPVPPPPPALAPMAVHTCVPGAQVWIDGAGVPSNYSVPQTQDGVYNIPTTVVAFNIHATAAGYPQYGVVAPTNAQLNTVVFFGNCTNQTQGGVHVVVTPAWSPLVPPLPAYPSRSQLANSQENMQGEILASACFTGNWWDPFITTFSDPACRQAVYTMKHAAGDQAIIIPLSWSYLESGVIGPTQGTDFWGNLTGLRSLLLEAIANGFYIDLRMAGDGESASGAPCPAGAYNDPVGHTYGRACVLGELPALIQALKGDGGTSTAGDLTPFIKFNTGFDGVFYGWEPSVAEIGAFGSAFRALLPQGYLAIEFNIGHIPCGEGTGSFGNPAGCLWNFDEVDAEFDPNQVHDDANWQISARLLGPLYKRPADQPAGDDPSPACYTCVLNSRGLPYVSVAFELDTYYWVRNSISLPATQANAAYLRAEGWVLVSSPK